MSRALLFLFAGFLIANVHMDEPAHADDKSSMLPPAPLNEQVLSVPGDRLHPAMLEVTLFMPDGPGPFPLAIMNHGADGKKSPRQNPRYNYHYSAFYFLSRGFFSKSDTGFINFTHV